MPQHYKSVVTIHQETGEHFIMVRGRVSKKYNPRDVWLRLTRERRTRLARSWRERNRDKYLAQQQRGGEHHKQICQRWERDNEKRRKSPRRKLFNKLRRLGVPMNDARQASAWGAS
jgi:hypothetical protein